MAASNYTALLNTQDQPKEIGVIVKYLKKFPLAYAVLSSSLTLQSLISKVFQSTVISTRARSKQLDVEFDLFQAALVLNKEEFAVTLGLSEFSPKRHTFFTPTSAQLLITFKETGYKFEDEKNHAFQEFENLVFPHHGTFSVPSSLDVTSDQLVMQSL
ncbi:unnamed protein product [Lactuca saligna]|uniref:Uncharacterized protein n=1 Tax=Lactuca saligna TaxID=75948 RepID=A0AA35VL09_LACSI|nr:unnamed protein product [Lactuca saligna]